MKQAKKETHRVIHGYDAMDRIREAGELIGELVGRDADKAVDSANMDFVMETVEISYQLVQRRDPETIKSWVEPKRDILLADLKRRGMDQCENAQCAMRKIEAALRWVDSWPRDDFDERFAALQARKAGIDKIDDLDERIAALKAHKAELERLIDGNKRAQADPIPGHKNLSNWNDYAFDCPEGTWTAKLEQKAWGRSANLILCFADVASGKQYRFSVFRRTQYKPRDGSHDFRYDADLGDVFELTTKKTKNGNPDLRSARKITAEDELYSRG